MMIMQEEAVSDVIGVLLLISITTIAIGIIAVNLISQVSVTSIPQPVLTIIWQDDPLTPNLDIKPYIFFERGETLFINTTSVRGNNQLLNSETEAESVLKIKKSNSNSYGKWNWTSNFTIGDALRWDGTNPTSISISFNQSGNEVLLFSLENQTQIN